MFQKTFTNSFWTDSRSLLERGAKWLRPSLGRGNGKGLFHGRSPCTVDEPGRRPSLRCSLWVFLVVAAGSIVWSPGALCQTSGGAKSKTSGTAPQRQSVNFEEELIEGSSQKPELFYLFQKKNFNYKKLIRLRENFLPEMRRTSEDLQRRGSGD